jgi:hypothetical protein
VPVSNVNGAVSADLTLDASGQRLTIRDLLILGIDQSGNSMTTQLSGSINCTTFQLEDGRLENGNYHTAAPPSLDFAFIGTARCTYSQDTASAIGMWSVEAEASSLIGGNGAWNLVLSE